MNTQPLVSVIIIFLNGGEFIEEAIASIFAQTYDNWELLLVDDGSTDQSTKIALDYAQKYPQKVRYFEHDHHQNLGMSASRNSGINHAKGQFIAYLDADDVWLPDKLTEQIAILESHAEAAMVYGWVKFWYSWTGKPEDQERDHFLDLGLPPNSLISPPNLLPILWKGQRQKPVPSNVMFRAEILKKIGKFEESFRGWAEDTVVYTKIGLHSPIYVSDKCWVKHREHETSDSFQFSRNGKIYSGNQTYFNWVEKYLIAQGMKNTELWTQLKKARFVYDYPLLHYLFQQGLGDLTITIGRQILPKSLRHWLWIHIGRKLYHHSLESSHE